MLACIRRGVGVYKRKLQDACVRATCLVNLPVDGLYAYLYTWLLDNLCPHMRAVMAVVGGLGSLSHSTCLLVLAAAITLPGLSMVTFHR